MGDVCPQCGNEYQSVASHWVQSSCDYPTFTNHQREIITGLLMGDGWISSSSINPRLNCKMISKNYLEYVDSNFGIFGNGVSIRYTAEESAEQARKSGFDSTAKEENYSDIYKWTSICHPELQEFSDWYSTGEKVWPQDIKLTPTVLKHWYCGDGNFNNNFYNNCIEISMSNEEENTHKVNEMFTNSDLPSPSSYNTSGNNCKARFTVDQSKELWEYMGDPLPDFEYKWPAQYRNT